MSSYDIVGSICIFKFDKESKKEKIKIARDFLEKHKNVTTILEKLNKVSGRLRTIKTKFLAGKNTRETIHRESGCLFKLNVEKCYFSPRLSNERLEIAREISGGRVLVLFAGVAPFSIIIAKNSNPDIVVSVELGKECCKYARENVKLNKVENKVKIIQGDVKRILPKIKDKFDSIVMPRPQLKDTFLKEVFKATRKGTRIFYYDFGPDPEKIVDKVLKESKEARKKIFIDKIKRAGDIAPYSYRWRVDLVVKN